MPYEYIQLDYLDLMSAGDPATRRQLLAMLLAELESSIPRMKILAEKAEWEALSALAHHMKSTLAFVGNEQMAAAVREIESLLADGKSLVQAYVLFDTLEELLPFVLMELRQEAMVE